MTLNKECFYKSLKNDFSEVGKVILCVIAILIGIAIGTVFSKLITDLVSQGITSVIVSSLIIVIASICMIYDLTTVNKQELRSKMVLYFIGTHAVILLGMFCVIVVSTIIILTMLGYSSNNGGNVILYPLMYWSGIVYGVMILQSLISIPLARAYALCKDVPEESGEKNDNV
jgi:hypothetical protein